VKDKILPFIIGVLVGAIIATAGFLIYNKIIKSNSNQPEMMQMNGRGQMERPSDENMEEPPEKSDKRNNLNDINSDVSNDNTNT